MGIENGEMILINQSAKTCTNLASLFLCAPKSILSGIQKIYAINLKTS
jgi:hypothetical protein